MIKNIPDCMSAMLSVFILIVSPFFLPAIGHSASQVTLTWEKPVDNRVAGYNLYYGVSGSDFKSFPSQTIHSADQTSCLIPDLEAGQLYNFAVTSVDSQESESDFSETFTYRVPVTSVDNDGDGYTAEEGDSNDNDPDIFPGAIEICGDGIDQDCDGRDLECTSEASYDFVMETGEVVIDEQWYFVAFEKAYVNPVVVAKPISLNGSEAAVIRIQNVTSNGFEIRVQEWEYLDGWHADETVGYMVIEAGHHVLPKGIHVEAGKFEANSSGTTVYFSETFNQMPVVVSAVTTENETDAIVGRLSNITLDGFNALLQEEESHKTAHYSYETVNYIAWEPSSGEVDGMNYIVDSTFDEVTHNFYQISFYPVFDAAPVFVADMQTTDGGNTANVRWQNKTGEGIEVQIDEEQSNDTEVIHTTEIIGYMCFANASDDSSADADIDGDGYTLSQGDCDDYDPSIYPGATEICGDGIDQDCDGSDLECAKPWWWWFYG